MKDADTRTGGQLIVDCLRLHGVDTVFTVPGESFLAVLDALYDVRDSIRLVVCRHEGGAAFMAGAYGKLTGQPGVMFVTKSPGACNAANGVCTAYYEEMPLILMVGHNRRTVNEQQAYQELDYRRMYGQFAKWIGQVDDASRVPEYINRAFHIATSGRPGPVVLMLCEDMQTEPTIAEPGARYNPPRSAPTPKDMEELRMRIAGAKKPLAIIGGGGWTPKACADFRAFAEANELPVTTGFRRQDLIDNRSPSYIGMAGNRMSPHVVKAIQGADLLLVVGQQIVDTITRKYTLIRTPKPDQDLIHVLPAADDLGRICRADLAISATLPEFCAAARALKPVDSSAWRQRTRDMRQALAAFQRVRPPKAGVNLGEVLGYLNERLPEDAIIASAAGGASHWAMHCIHYRRYPTLLGPGTGTLGYAVPATTAAKILYPDRMVVGIMGDCDFMMSSPEFATAVAYGAAAIFIIFNNHMYGSQRMHQEGEYPGRVIGSVEIANPDFPTLARSYGAFGETVKATADFPRVFDRAVASSKPAIIDVDLDPKDLSYVSPVPA